MLTATFDIVLRRVVDRNRRRQRALPITGDRVEWFSDPKANVWALAPKPLQEVIGQISDQLRRAQR